jgi:large subunit ribosomal protein L22
MKAYLKFYRQAPRKTRLIADMVRGKSVTGALTELSHIDKRAAGPFKKLISSAIANAKVAGKKEDNLFIKEVRVDKGHTFKRFMPRARGRATPIRKRTSNIIIKLEEKETAKK